MIYLNVFEQALLYLAEDLGVPTNAARIGAFCYAWRKYTWYHEGELDSWFLGEA